MIHRKDTASLLAKGLVVYNEHKAVGCSPRGWEVQYLGSIGHGVC